MKKIISFNANGLRSAITKGFTDWIQVNSFDIICVQETKMDISYADENYFLSQGYHSYWHCAEKKGYSGVLIITKDKPLNITYGTGISKYDSEGRLLVVDYPDFSVANCYFPSGSASEERHEFKMKFLKDMYPVFKKMLIERPKLIVTGDYNIVHKGIDIHNPERKDNPSGYRPEERVWLDKWFTELFSDSFRIISPEKKEYSWWSYRAGSYFKDKGWRIDYQSVSKSLESKVKEFKHHRELRFSDHCPLEAVYDI